MSLRRPAVLVGTALLAACSGPSDEPSVLLAPNREGFSAVSAVLEPRCGTLDCHGGPARNLRIYGHYGLRASGADVTGGVATTSEELARTLDSLLLIAPEALSHVVAERGARPERWVVVSKGRATEHHEGGARLVPGGPADACLMSWLSGSVNVAICAADSFTATPRPGDAW